MSMGQTGVENSTGSGFEVTIPDFALPRKPLLQQQKHRFCFKWAKLFRKPDGSFKSTFVDPTKVSSPGLQSGTTVNRSFPRSARRVASNFHVLGIQKSIRGLATFVDSTFHVLSSLALEDILQESQANELRLGCEENEVRNDIWSFCSCLLPGAAGFGGGRGPGFSDRGLCRFCGCG